MAIDFRDIPLNVELVASFGPHELLALSPPDAVAVAKECGLTFEEYITAIEWLSDYHAKHAEALRNYAEERPRA